MSWSAADHQYMQQALTLAARGRDITPPNPSVGCVLVRDGVVVGEGHSQPTGQAHAEVTAMRMAGELARGATAYVTLEPCSHHGRTPPCADALIAAGVVRAVVALRDPNPLVAGQGLARLRAAGVEASHGLLAKEAAEHHRGFLSRMIRGRPWLRLKIATSLDGRTALQNGQSQWITGPAARADVQKLRARSSAMLTGIGTVLADDAQLTVRDFDIGRQPLRVVVDSLLRMPPNAKMLQTPGVLIATAYAEERKHAELIAAGAELLVCPGDDGRVDLAALLAELGRHGCNEVTAEAGAQLNGALLRAALVDEIVLYQAPVLIGDPARGAAWLDLPDLADKQTPVVRERRMVGDDLRWDLRFTDSALFVTQE
ncbi:MULTISPECIES: bifunctional diaminohydroxyphosphoribosylaminopyrimidine deaminase/5-amino-6-(5-phosphoribosylamino)uracil reductase RibD [Silvimonas]|uniref:bifunctional diaminohydroxyphosphoribosylaminopyrimidine deaminase/5-amino-6-(5-phosphoribosylamino)uracil reductase RibD n=1 Tax=Silvimonas TaxID=300264 RepID=UPI0024B32E99|nr:MULTISPECIES: bifunctional diaminohydroxyphosphoribosylaminopyrimidine deaminase/5-amino-6-(5-phosphoribosylamino)uracil reductase RibD [Silvimonas]MDR3428365.1 bifunctional diaminohydroxyphosphoribosylaminopyrimidine deaminase/5-amino-6-(5-phosphoribosylamino)uracil reductase RibD [Silvimonas sp.]